ncbi:WhiB family transcriptional regulator [Streptomyces sp. NBC_01383]|uniref:WhiB family transcriptional regulator n=1 Tax=Streptomyces sp. NBC_01383 TaxID=2903846 RepID=UPI00324AF3E7
MNDTTWKGDALCAQTDPEVHFPEAGGTSRNAKRTCMACPVRPNCLDYAVDTEQYWGVWGGLGQDELRRLIRARRAETTAA